MTTTTTTTKTYMNKQSRGAFVRRILSGAGVAALAMMFGAGQAHASVWQFDDTLEPNGAGWQVYNSSVRSSAQVWSAAADARSPKTSGFMIMFGGPTDWSSFGRPVNISVVYPGATQKTCAARMYISPYQGLRPAKPTIHGSLDVIDGDTWTYLASQPFSLVPSTTGVAIGPYLPITTAAFVPSRPNIFVRVVLAGNNTYQAAFVDDLTVQCQD